MNNFLGYKLYDVEEVLNFIKTRNIKIDQDLINNIANYAKTFLNFKNSENENLIEHGFFFIEDEEDASHLGGPFFKHFGFVRVTLSDVSKLLTKEEIIRNNFKSEMELFSKYEHKKIFEIVLNHHLIMPTKECPYTIFICGNDDFSWTKTVETEERAKRELWDLCVRCGDKECGDFRSIINDNGFIFTN